MQQRGLSPSVSDTLCCPQAITADGHHLPIIHIDCEIQINVVVATVILRTVYKNITGSTVSGIYKAPNAHGKATITACDVKFPGHHMVTAVVDPEVMDLKSELKPMTDAHRNQFQDLLFFLLPFDGLHANDEISVELSYIQNLIFTPSGTYDIAVPTYVPQQQQSTLREMKYQGNISCQLDVGSVDCIWECQTHQVHVVAQSDSFCSLKAAIYPENNNYFHLKLNARSQAISASCCIQPSSRSDSPGGNFMVFVSPPSLLYEHSMGRNMVFLLDKSGSMFGEALEQAVKGLIQALELLKPADCFAICAFNHTTSWFDVRSDPLLGTGVPALYRATVENISMAKAWVLSIRPDGGTDIITPYRTATEMLESLTVMGSYEKVDQRNMELQHSRGILGGHSTVHPSNNNESQRNLPVIFLLTDGAVCNEREICEYSVSRVKRAESGGHLMIRTFTFGIGPFVNPVFLKTLAAQGRGHADICLHKEILKVSILELMNKSSYPLLMDITIGLPENNLGISLFPFPIPDLYMGCPVAVAGSWKAQKMFPHSVTISGRLSNGSYITMPMPVRNANTGSLEQAFGSFHIDSIVSAYWMKSENDKEKEALRQYAIDLSIRTSIPCTFTQSIAYETRDTSDGSNKEVKGKKVRSSNSAAIVAGSALLLGGVAAIMLFGNVGATNSNLNVSDSLNLLSSGNFDLSFINGLKIPGVDVMGALQSFGGALGDGTHFVGEGLGQAGSAIGSTVQGGFSSIGQVNVQPVIDRLGDGASCCVACCDCNCDFGAVNSCFNGIAPCCIGVGEVLSVVGDIGAAAGNIGGCSIS